DRQDDVCFRGDLGRAGGDGATFPEEFGRAAAAVAGDVEAAHHQVPGDGQAHLAQAYHAHSVHRCLLAAVAWYPQTVCSLAAWFKRVRPETACSLATGTG